MIKKIACTFCMALMAILVYSQERVEKQLVLKNGTTISGYITTQSDGSFIVETSTGDMFFYTPSEVKRVIAPSAPATVTNNSSAIVYKKGGSIRFIENDKKLEQADFIYPKDWGKYKGAQNTRGWGIGLLVAGPLVTSAGIFGILYSNANWNFLNEYTPFLGMDAWGLETASIVTAATGGVLTVVGLTCTIIGNVKIKNIGKQYNNNPGYAIDFGTQQHGIGFAMTF